jgi:hypothetical protein
VSDKCPTCQRSDFDCYGRHYACNDPWHGDAHLRRVEAKARTATTERAEQPTTIRMRAETSRRCFEDALAFFVQKYAPEQPYDRDYFQRDLMMLMRDAMQHQSGVFGMHIERTEMTLDALVNASTGSLNAIFKEKK